MVAWDNMLTQSSLHTVQPSLQWLSNQNSIDETNCFAKEQLVYSKVISSEGDYCNVNNYSIWKINSISEQQGKQMNILLGSVPQPELKPELLPLRVLQNDENWNKPSGPVDINNVG